MTAPQVAAPDYTAEVNATVPWELPPKPKGMRWATYERWVAKYDAAEERLDAQLASAMARLMKRL
jgi:hypothetical protein